MMKKLLCTISLWVLLSGCLSNETEDAELAVVSSYFSSAEFEPSPRFLNLFTEPRPVLDIEFIELGVAGKLILEQQDGPFARYLSSDLGGFVLQKGLIHSVFGFGEPLAGADLSDPLALIFSGQTGTADRFHTYTNGEGRVVKRTYRCRIESRGRSEVQLTTGTVNTPLIAEQCQGLDQSFENLYWVDKTRGEIIQSRQWVGPNVGSVVTQVTHP